MAASYESALEIADTLNPADKKKLARRLLRDADNPAPGERVSIMELKGLGKEVWEGIDVEAFIKAERDSWER